MEKLFQSIALVQKAEGKKNKLLLSWDSKQSCWRFIVADRLDRESFRESISREVAWQLNLDRNSDLLVSKMAQLSMEFVEDMPDETQRHVAIAFYSVRIYRRNQLESIACDPRFRWISAAEVCQGATEDGQTIDPRIVTWINKWSVVQPWQ